MATRTCLLACRYFAQKLELQFHDHFHEAAENRSKMVVLWCTCKLDLAHPSAYLAGSTRLIWGINLPATLATHLVPSTATKGDNVLAMPGFHKGRFWPLPRPTCSEHARYM